MNGLLLVDKPKGWTSFDVVAKVRNLLKDVEKTKVLGFSQLDAVQGSQEERTKRTNSTESERQTQADIVMRQKLIGATSHAGRQGKAVRKIRVGHCGTLDPLATGLLLIVVGDYTKRAQEFTRLDKIYEVELKLGETSTTGDEEGEKAKVSAKKPDLNEIQRVLDGFVGEIEQMPPAHSAIKVNGQRAYRLARAGKEVKLEPRQIKIYSITDVKYSYPTVSFTTKVSSGTYIRTLVEDIGKKLETGGYTTGLRRTEVGKFSVQDAQTIEKLDLQKLITSVSIDDNV